MKQVENLFHFTDKFDIIASILKDGFKPSYSKEVIGQRNTLVPMISFMNVLLRDVGPDEVVDYGDYGIGINREFATTIRLNPVCYVYDESVIDSALKNIQNLSMLPQTIDILKEHLIDKLKSNKKVTEIIPFIPKPIKEVEDLLNSITKETEKEIISSVKALVTKIYESAYYQLLLAKPYKVLNKKGEPKIAYNEREWRKGYPELGYILETNATGVKSKQYEKWIATDYPHFEEEEYRLKIGVENISFILIKEAGELDRLKNILLNLCTESTLNRLLESNQLRIGTIEELKQYG